jgi:hypothetical protein
MKGTTRIKILSIIFIVLAIVAYFALQEKFSTDTIVKDKNSIAIDDTASINKIVIEKKDVTVLTRTEKNTWLVNNKYEARQYAVNMLMLGLNQLQIKRQVSEESKKNVFKILTTEGAKVTIFFGGDKKTMTFSTNENDINTTYFLDENSNVPYIAYVPGVPGDINNIFRFKENDWRSRKLFASSPMGIKSVRVSYPKEEDSSFEIFYDAGDFHIRGLDKVDTIKLYQYLDYFSNSPVSSYIPGSADSIRQILKRMPLYAIIELTDINPDKSATIEIYKNPEPQKDYSALVSKSNEAVTLNRQLFDGILVKKSYFKGR